MLFTNRQTNLHCQKHNLLYSCLYSLKLNDNKHSRLCKVTHTRDFHELQLVSIDCSSCSSVSKVRKVLHCEQRIGELICYNFTIPSAEIIPPSIISATGSHHSGRFLTIFYPTIKQGKGNTYQLQIH